MEQLSPAVGIAYLLGPLTNVHFSETAGKISIAAAGGDVERIIPMYITEALPRWFSALFLVTLLSAAMSTLSSQFHFGVRSLGIRLEDGVEIFRQTGPILWAYVDPALIGLPVAVLTTILVSAFTARFSQTHLNRCFAGGGRAAAS